MSELASFFDNPELITKLRKIWSPLNLETYEVLYVLNIDGQYSLFW